MVHPVIPTGQAVRITMVPAAALPLRPGSKASAGASTDSSPAASTASAVVWNRVSPSVMQAVPAAMLRAVDGARSTEKRSVPTAFVAAVRAMPRIWAW